MNLEAILSVPASFLGSLLFTLIVQRPLFYLFNRRSVEKRPTAQRWLQIYRHGLSTDLIVSVYLTVIPWLIALSALNIPGFPLITALCISAAVTALPLAVLCVADTALYDFWHFKIDSSVLVFLKSLKGVFASVSTAYIIAGGAAILSVAAVYAVWMILIYSLCAKIPAFPTSGAGYLWGNLTMLGILAVMAVIFRGLRIRPNNPTIAFFSPDAFENHLALNGVFNFVYSLGAKDFYHTLYRYFPAAVADEERAALFPTDGVPHTRFLSTDRPNIIFIVWESLHKRFVGAVGGDESVTPNFNSLAREGVLFSNMDCGSFLTDRGLISIFSGLPGQPDTTIGNHSRKLPNLPAFPRRLKELGYNTLAVHGGDLSVRRKADYYLASGHDRLISESDFASSDPRCKWGVHDEVTFRRLFDEISRMPEGKPWMATLQTLSSHEPFKVPAQIHPDPMANAFAYTDRCLGEFAERLRNSPFWHNTMVVVVADHGTHYSSEYGIPLDHYQFPKIPALIFGGAVTRAMNIGNITAQTDLAATIMGQMGLPHSEFLFSRDVLADTYTRPWSFHCYHNGFAVRTPSSWLDFSTLTDAPSWGDDKELERMGRVTLQSLYQYLDKL